MDCGNYLAGDIAASRIRRDGGNGWLSNVAAAKDCVMELAQWVGVACRRQAGWIESADGRKAIQTASVSK